MSKHTPGPWSVHTFGSFDVFEIHGPETDETDGCCTLADLGTDTEGPKEVREANARLIAAAPELLEALRRALLDATTDLTDGRGCECARCQDARSAARAALAKAEGK